MLNNADLEKMTLDDIIVYFLELQKKGISVSYKRDGHILSSDNISWDSAYQIFYGMTKQQYDAILAKKIMEHTQRRNPVDGAGNEN